MVESKWNGKSRESRSSQRAAAIVFAIALIPGCDGMFVDPAPVPTALLVSYSLAHADGAISADAFEKADNVVVRVQVTGASSVERTIEFPAGQSEVRATIELDVDGAEVPAVVTVQLRRGSDNLYSGTRSIVIRTGETQEVTMPLTPVPGALSVPATFEVNTLSEAVQLPGNVTFATGDPISGSAIQWSTTAPPSFMQLTSSGVLEAFRNGTYAVTATSGSFTANMSVVVDADATISSVSPPEVTTGSRVVLQIQGENMNNATEVRVCGSAHVENEHLSETQGGRLIEIPVTWLLFEGASGAFQVGPRCVEVHSPQGVGIGSTTLTAPPVGPPAAIVFLEGMEQSQFPGRPLPTAPLVEVLDADGRPVPGVEVLFTPDQGGGVEHPEVITDGDGRASPGTWTLGDRPFTDPHHNNLTAQIPGVDPAGIFAVVENPCLQEWPTLQFGNSASGILIPGRSCTSSSGRLLDRFVVSTPSAPAIRFSVTAEGFPPGVFTHLPGGSPQISGRGAGTGVPTVVNELVVPASTYWVAAATPVQNPLDPTFFGSYTLLTEPVGEPQVGCMALTSVYDGSVAQGVLTDTDCNENVNEGSRWDGYVILLQGGQTVTVTVTSSVPFGTTWWVGGEFQEAQPGGEPGAELTWELTAPSTSFYSFFVINELPHMFGPYTMTFSLSGGAASPPAAPGWREPLVLEVPDRVLRGGAGR